MHSENDVFRYESLEDKESIGDLLRAVADGLNAGHLQFNDSSDQIEMIPQGLLNLKVTASKEEGRNRVNLRVTWHDDTQKQTSKKKLKVKTSPAKT